MNETSTIAAYIVKSPDDRRLYLDNFMFRGAVDSLIAWLPLWVAAMAEDCRERQTVLDQSLKNLELIPATPSDPE